MKLNIGNRILMLLHWLCSLMICVALVMCLVVPDLRANVISRAEGELGGLGAKIVGGVALALYLALSVATLCLLLRRRKRAERGFISVGPDESGKVRIAVSAVEQMVRQSVQSIDGITEMKVDIEGLDDAIGIIINAIIVSGAHVPTITANMQRAITEFVEFNCGVAVHSVEITINAVSGKADHSRRRQKRLGKGRDEAAPMPYEAVAPADDSAVATVAAGDGAATGAPEGEPQAAEAMPGAQAPAYDPDKPYESEFAKDYAAMKAREDADAGEADSDGE